MNRQEELKGRPLNGFEQIGERCGSLYEFVWVCDLLVEKCKLLNSG